MNNTVQLILSCVGGTKAGSVAGRQCVPHVAVMDGAFPIPPANTGFLVLPSGHTQLQAFFGLFTLFCAQYVAPHIFPFDTLIFGMNGQTCDQAQPLMEQQTNTIQVPQCWRRNQVVLKTGRRFRFAGDTCKMMNREFYRRGRSQICLRVESQVELLV